MFPSLLLGIHHILESYATNVVQINVSKMHSCTPSHNEFDNPYSIIMNALAPGNTLSFNLVNINFDRSQPNVVTGGATAA